MAHAHVIAPPAGFSGRSARPSRSTHLLPIRFILIGMILAASLLVMTSVRAEAPQAVAEYVVQPGDTLWEIAGGVATPGSDLRETVMSVKELNHLAGSMLHPGQVLLVPAG